MIFRGERKYRREKGLFFREQRLVLFGKRLALRTISFSKHKIVFLNHNTVVQKHKIVFLNHNTVVQKHKSVFLNHNTVVQNHNTVVQNRQFSRRNRE